MRHRKGNSCIISTYYKLISEHKMVTIHKPCPQEVCYLVKKIQKNPQTQYVQQRTYLLIQISSPYALSQWWYHQLSGPTSHNTKRHPCHLFCHQLPLPINTNPVNWLILSPKCICNGFTLGQATYIFHISSAK